MKNIFLKMVEQIEQIEKNHSYFDEEELREFYEVFGDSIKIIVKYNNGERDRITITEFYNLKVDYTERNFGIREVFLWSEDYQRLLEMKKTLMQF